MEQLKERVDIRYSPDKKKMVIYSNYEIIDLVENMKLPDSIQIEAIIDIESIKEALENIFYNFPQYEKKSQDNFLKILKEIKNFYKEAS